VNEDVIREERFRLEHRFLEALKGLGKPLGRGALPELKRSKDITEKPASEVDEPGVTDAHPDPTERVETTEGDERGKLAEALPHPTSSNLFQHPDAHPIVLDLALLREYGPEWMLWEEETLEWRIPQDFRSQSVSDLNLDKIMAVKALHFVDTFWKQWEIFLWCAMPFNSVPTDFKIMQVPTAAECLVAVDVANRIREDVNWSDEVKAYIASVFQHDGIFCPVEPCDFVPIEPRGLIVDCTEVSKHWPEVRRTRKVDIKDGIIEEQLNRALIINDYLEESRDRLRGQTALLAEA